LRPNPGDLVGSKYRIVRLIGDGGMGAVYEARHEVLGSPVALKFLHAELARRPGLASRFLQEAKVSASIQSPHVTRVTDVDTAPDGSPYLVMELLAGESLQQLLDRRSKLPKDQAIDYALQISSGLEAAHALGVVHRDLKPDNVFITPSAGGPLLKLLDFGIAKLRESSEFKKGLTRPGAIMGTPEYMAPEQLYAAERVDHRADIYSLGAIIYEMLTGERPAYGDDAPQIIAQVAAGNVKRINEHDPTLPEGLADVVHKAIAADKSERFPGVIEMRVALAPFAGQLSHAGRLAASLAASIPPPPSEKRPADTVDAAPLPERKSAVPATLPPDDDSAASAVQRPPPTAAAGPLIKERTEQVPEQRLPYAAASSAAPATPAPYVPVGGYPVYMGTPPRKSRKLLGALLALLLGVLAAGGVIAALVIARQNEPDDRPVSPLTPPTTTLTAQPGPPVLPPGTDSTEPEATPSAKPGTKTPPASRGKADGGAKDGGAGGKDSGGGQTTPFPPIPLPSGFPPLPSGFPPFFPFPKSGSSAG
jgi:eukaryotic-like serine/threonine-protein kinase